MPYLNIVNNVFVKETKNVFCQSRTINGMLREANATPEGPFIVLQGQTPILRKDWDVEQNELSAFSVVGVPAGILEITLITTLVLTSASLAFSLYMYYKYKNLDKIGNVTTPKIGPAVFTFDGQQNIKRLNEPIECAYGKNRWYPSYLCAPYVTYVNNQAFLRVWLSLGNGNFEVEDVFVGDNRISSYPGAAWCYIQARNGPNNTNIPFSEALGDLGNYFDVVLSPKELAGVELKAPNEENYSEVGFISVCGDNDILSHLQFNFSFPQGCFGYGLSERTVEVKITWYKESGMYQGIFEEETLSFTYATQNPQKVSIRRQLLPDGSASSTRKGKWLVKAQRITSIPDEFSGRDQVILESVTGLGGEATGYKNSALYVALQGSDTMVTDAASKINLVATRKLPVFNGTAWETVPTRHPIWAAVDVLRAEYGAKQADTRFDLTHFKGLADKYPKVTFDHVFNEKTTIHDALRAILKVMRAMPYTAGSDYRIAVDSPYDLPVAFFGPDNAYDMNWSMVLKQELDNDAVSVSYVDPDTGLAADVQFTPTDSLGINPKKVSVVGLTSREDAWRMAAYIYQSEVLQRDVIEFYAGLDGFIPVLGDLISVSWPFPAWGQAGIVLSHDNGTLTCSETLDAVIGKAWVTLRSATGGVLGPYRCVIGTNANEIVLDEPLPAGIDFDCLGKDPVMFAFGSSSTLSRQFRVTASEPSETKVRITASTYDPSVFAYDIRSAPVDDKEPYPISEGEASWIIVEENTEKLLRMRWSASDSPYGYRVRYTWDPTFPSPVGSDLPHLYADNWYPNYANTTSDFETADVFGTTAYLRRAASGELFIELAGLDSDGNPVAEQTRVWKAKFADFAQATGVNTATALKFQDGTVDGYWQASIGVVEYGVAVARSTQVLRFQTDMPAGAGTKLQLTLFLSSSVLTPVIGNTIEFLFPDTGYLEITPEMLEAKGWQLGFAAQRAGHLKIKLVNLDLTELRIPTDISNEDWSGYTNNAIKFAKSTYGQLDISNYEDFISHSGIITKLYIGLATKLIQPDGRDDFDQYWVPDRDPDDKLGNDFERNVVGAIGPAITRLQKQHRYSVFGRLNAKCRGAFAITGDIFSHRIAALEPCFWNDPAWIVPGGTGLTPYAMMTEGIGWSNRRYVKFFKPMEGNDAYEVEINPGTVYCAERPEPFLIPGYSWCVGKVEKTGDAVTPFNPGELEAIEHARMVFIEWEYPTGLNIIRQRVNLSTMWGSQTGFNPPPPVPTAYSKEIEVTTSCP